MRNHCVFYRSKLKYDGRVCAIIRSLAESYPNDSVYLYEYPVNDEYHQFPSNVKIIKSKLLFGDRRVSHFTQMLKAIIYNWSALIFLIRKRPISIQVHHDVVMYGCIVYKFFFKKNRLIYNDEEAYFPKENNISKISYFAEYWLIRLSDMVIITNTYRKRALFHIHKNKIRDYILVDNYVFEKGNKLSEHNINKIANIKNEGKRIVVHQGDISLIRRSDLLSAMINEIPEEWVFCFIGVSEKRFEEFTKTINAELKNRVCNLGYIDYDELYSFYKNVDASVIFYDNSTFNNNFCAPNRLYSAVNCGVPIIVNSDNYTLSDFVKKMGVGVAIKDMIELKKFFEDIEIYRCNTESLIGKYEFNSTIPKLMNYYSRI